MQENDKIAHILPFEEQIKGVVKVGFYLVCKGNKRHYFKENLIILHCSADMYLQNGHHEEKKWKMDKKQTLTLTIKFLKILSR